MSWNKHTHEWFSNSNGSFCLHCGEFCKSSEEKDAHGGALYAGSMRKDSLMQPGEKITEEKAREGDRFDPWSR